MDITYKIMIRYNICQSFIRFLKLVLLFFKYILYAWLIMSGILKRQYLNMIFPGICMHYIFINCQYFFNVIL